MQRAIQLTSDEHPDMKGYLSNLGGSQLHRFERIGELTDLDNAMSNQQMAVNLVEDGIQTSQSFSPPRQHQLLRFQRLDVLTDLEDSISNLQSAAHLINDRSQTSQCVFPTSAVASELASYASAN